MCDSPSARLATDATDGPGAGGVDRQGAALAARYLCQQGDAINRLGRSPRIASAHRRDNTSATALRPIELDSSATEQDVVEALVRAVQFALA